MLITLICINTLMIRLAHSFHSATVYRKVKQNMNNNDYCRQNWKVHDNDNKLLRLALNLEEREGCENTRRDILQGTIASIVLTGLPGLSLSSTEERIKEAEDGYVRIPLIYKNDAYQISYRISGILFNAIVDTGSPFLMIPGGSCARISRYKWGGCYNDMITLYDENSNMIPNLEPTYEYFDGVEGNVQWRIGSFYFENATGTILVPNNPSSYDANDNKLIFGVASDTLMAGPGGIFLGLVRDTDQRIRPSFLGQTNVKAFQLDFISNPCTLTLSTKSLLSNSILPTINSYIPLVNDLKQFGDPARHYTAKVSNITVNGHLLATSTKKQPIYAIFDTGVTGMVISRDLYDRRYSRAVENREKSFWGFVELSFQTTSISNGKVDRDNNVTMFANKPVTTPLGPSSWSATKKHREPYVIVVGLSFLNNTVVTIDIDDEKLWVQT